MKQETIDRIRRFTSDREWEQYHTPANLAKSISIEANELLECFQWSDTDFDIDKDGLTKSLNDIFFFAKVYDKTQLLLTADDYVTDKSVRGDFVRAVWESNLSEEEKSRIIMCGLNAIKGEEI